MPSLFSKAILLCRMSSFPPDPGTFAAKQRGKLCVQVYKLGLPFYPVFFIKEQFCSPFAIHNCLPASKILGYCNPPNFSKLINWRFWHFILKLLIFISRSISQHISRGPVVEWLVQRFQSKRLRVRSRRSATFTPSAHVRRQSLPVWPPTLNKLMSLDHSARLRLWFFSIYSQNSNVSTEAPCCNLAKSGKSHGRKRIQRGCSTTFEGTDDWPNWTQMGPACRRNHFRCRHGTAPPDLRKKLKSVDHGRTTRGASGNYVPFRSSSTSGTVSFSLIVLPLFGTLFPTNYKKQVLLIVLKGSTWNCYQILILPMLWTLRSIVLITKSC